ncbi:MAG: DUF721 domain-containing protein [Synergistaceae bacterium]|nr:DUF721 domain-containing protein [Synergistaceae bacterium]
MSEERVGALIDVYAMFPKAAERVAILERLKLSWASVVGPALARWSEPYNLGVDELCVAVRNKRAAAQLGSMKGTILRKMEARFGYEHEKDFTLTITDRVPPP